MLRTIADTSSNVANARTLGWASIGIGAAELLAPRQISHLLGLRDRGFNRMILRTMGLRELMHGVAILSQKQPARPMATAVWSRVAGDVLDTALLGAAAKNTNRPKQVAIVAALVLGIGILDYLTAKSMSANYGD